MWYFRGTGLDGFLVRFIEVALPGARPQVLGSRVGKIIDTWHMRELEILKWQ